MPEALDIKDLRGDLSDEDLINNVRRDKEASESFLSSSVHARWEEAIKLWQRRHLTTPKPNRAKLFMPKPRNIVERIKAGLLDAFFSSEDFASIQPGRKNVPDDVFGAKVRQAYLNYRLSGHNIPWFQICYSAFDDLGVHNLCVARVGWVKEFEILRGIENVPISNPGTGQPMIGEDGQPLTEEQERTFEQLVKDEPEILLRAPERMWVDPRVDWTNVYAGQYVIEQDFIPLQKLKQMADSDPLINLDEIENIGSPQKYTDTVVNQRYNQTTPQHFDDLDRVEIEVWRYWYKIGSTWWLAWTREDQGVIRRAQKNPFALKTPNYVFGFHVPESHLMYSDSVLNVHKDHFVAKNGIVNQRFDNVALILDKHAIVSEEAQADPGSLINRRAGGYTVVKGDVREAIAWDEIPDISASAYNEEVLIDRSIEEGAGVSDQSQGLTPATDELATQSVIRRQERDKKEAVNIRIVAATFIIPVIEMFLALADQFENDLQVLQIVGATLGIGEGDDNLPDLLKIKGQYSVKVNAGIGTVTNDIKIVQLQKAIQDVAANFGPLATLPLWKDYLPLVGVSNVNEVLQAINQATQIDRLLALLNRAQGGASGQQGAGRRRQPQGSERQTGERDTLRRQIQGRQAG